MYLLERATRKVVKLCQDKIMISNKLPLSFHFFELTKLLYDSGVSSNIVLIPAMLHGSIDQFGVTHTELSKEFTPLIADVIQEFEIVIREKRYPHRLKKEVSILYIFDKYLHTKEAYGETDSIFPLQIDWFKQIDVTQIMSNNTYINHIL